jgi:hypothetical protein
MRKNANSRGLSGIDQQRRIVRDPVSRIPHLLCATKASPLDCFAGDL